MGARASWVDYAKAIGIILVVYGHVARGLYNAGIDVPADLYVLLDSIVYSFHMPLFFFLSGLFFYSSFQRRGGKALIFNKIDTIFYPYLLWSILQGGIEVLLSNYTNGSVHLSDVLSLLWAPRAQFWFLYALFAIFIVVTLIYSIGSKPYKALCIVIFALSATLYIFPVIISGVSLSLYLSSNLVFFSLGIVFTKYFDVKYFSNRKAVLLSACAFVAAQWLFHGYMGLLYIDKGVATLLLAVVSIIFIVSLTSFLALKEVPFLRAVGAASMAIFLAHILAGSGIRVVLNKFFGVNSFEVHLVLGCLVGIVLPMIFFELVNRFKIPYVFSAPMSNIVKLFSGKNGRS